MTPLQHFLNQQTYIYYILHVYGDQRVKPNLNSRHHIIPANQNKGDVLQLVTLLEVFNFYGWGFLTAMTDGAI